MLTDEQGNPIHAPKPEPPSTQSLPIKVTDTTQWDCYNLYPGISWEPRRAEGTIGPCVHYDDNDYQRSLEDWEEKQAEFLENLSENNS